MRYELWICVTWSLIIKPAESVSLIVNLRDERNKGVETEILLLKKKRSQTILVTGSRLFLHFFVLDILHLQVRSHCLHFPSQKKKNIALSVSWITEQNISTLIWHGLKTTCAETVEYISMPYKVVFISFLSIHCSSCQVIVYSKEVIVVTKHLGIL